jgi:hypothetical protein
VELVYGKTNIELLLLIKFYSKMKGNYILHIFLVFDAIMSRDDQFRNNQIDRFMY